MLTLPPDEFLIFGHRGASAHAHENSVAAIRLTAAQGAHGVELDVRRTADGVLVVHHDAQLSPARCVKSNGARVKKRAIGEMAWNALEGIECAGPADSEVARAGIPRLEQVLELARDAAYPVRLNLEIKKRKSSRDVVYDVIAAVLVDVDGLITNYPDRALRILAEGR